MDGAETLNEAVRDISKNPQALFSRLVDKYMLPAFAQHLRGNLVAPGTAIYNEIAYGGAIGSFLNTATGKKFANLYKKSGYNSIIGSRQLYAKASAGMFYM